MFVNLGHPLCFAVRPVLLTTLPVAGCLWCKSTTAAFKMHSAAERQLLSRLSLPLLLWIGITGSTVALFGRIHFILSPVYLLKCCFPSTLGELWKHEIPVLHEVKDSNVQAWLVRLVKALCSSPSHLGKGVAATPTQLFL